MVEETPIRLVVFDLDGTLVDSLHNICTAMSAAFGGLGLVPPGTPDVRRIIGLPLAQGIAILAPEADPHTIERLAEGYSEVFRRRRQEPGYHEPLFPGAQDTLEALDRAGYLLGVATGKGRTGLNATLEQHGLEHFFLTLQTADDGPGKPHPAILHQAMEAVGAVPQNTTIVGDTTFDMALGVNAGAVAIGVSWGYHAPDDLLTAGARRVIDTFGDLLPALEEGVA